MNGNIVAIYLLSCVAVTLIFLNFDSKITKLENDIADVGSQLVVSNVGQSIDKQDVFFEHKKNYEYLKNRLFEDMNITKKGE